MERTRVKGATMRHSHSPRANRRGAASGHGCAAAAHAQQIVLEVIPLHYRNAEEIIPVLEPLVARGGTISGLNNQLILRTTPDNLAEIKHVLASSMTARASW